MCGSHDHSHESKTTSRRSFLTTGTALAAAGAGLAATAGSAAAGSTNSAYADPAEPALPPSDMKLDRGRTAIVIVDPQIDFLSPDGVTWGVVGASVEEHNTVENIERLFKRPRSSTS